MTRLREGCAIAYVFFSSARSRRPSQPFRVAWRHPAKAFHAAFAAANRAVSRSEVAHVAIGDEQRVLNPRYSGATFWSIYNYSARFPTLLHVYEVPTPRPIDLNLPPVPSSPWDSVERFLTHGRTDTDECPLPDCVGTVRMILRRAGLDVPPMRTAAALDHWLQERQYRRATFT